MIGEVDQDGNGCITFNEFVWLMTRWEYDFIGLECNINFREIHDGEIEEEIREAFRVFDREGNGFITVPDLTEVLLKLGEKLSSEECQG